MIGNNWRTGGLAAAWFLEQRNTQYRETLREPACITSLKKARTFYDWSVTRQDSVRVLRADDLQAS